MLQPKKLPSPNDILGDSNKLPSPSEILGITDDDESKKKKELHQLFTLITEIYIRMNSRCSTKNSIRAGMIRSTILNNSET